jgi:hypothetical protein
MMKKKSDAANIFGRISAGHREVFELCEEYRTIVAKEIPNIHPNSPRLRALSKGSQFAGGLHRHHMLRWAELETRSLTNEAQSAETVVGKAGYAQRAKAAIDFALSHYPDERALRESADLLDEILLSLKNGSDTNDTDKPHPTDEDADVHTVDYGEVAAATKRPGHRKKREN